MIYFLYCFVHFLWQALWLLIRAIIKLLFRSRHDDVQSGSLLHILINRYSAWKSNLAGTKKKINFERIEISLNFIDISDGYTYRRDL